MPHSCCATFMPCHILHRYHKGLRALASVRRMEGMMMVSMHTHTPMRMEDKTYAARAGDATQRTNVEALGWWWTALSANVAWMVMRSMLLPLLRRNCVAAVGCGKWWNNVISVRFMVAWVMRGTVLWETQHSEARNAQRRAARTKDTHSHTCTHTYICSYIYTRRIVKTQHYNNNNNKFRLLTMAWMFVR